MRVYTLGTSHGDSTDCRLNSSTVYQTDNGTLYMVDAGAPCEALLRRQGLLLDRLKCTFVTHMHDDHAGGLSGLIKQAVKHDANRSWPLLVFLPEAKAISALQNWIFALHEEADSPSVGYFAVEDGPVFEDENLRVYAVRTAHLRTRGRTEGDPCSFAYVLCFKKEKIKVLHSGDLRADFSDFPQLAAAEAFDLCVCEATHYDPYTAKATLKNAQFKRLIFNHIGNRWHNRTLEDGSFYNGERALQDCFADLPYPVEISHDGDVFELYCKTE